MGRTAGSPGLGLELDCQGLSATVQQEQLSDADGSHQLTETQDGVWKGRHRKGNSLMLTYSLDEPHPLTVWKLQSVL